MNPQNEVYLTNHSCNTAYLPPPTVEQAEEALKAAKAREKAQRKAAKKAAKVAAQKVSDRELGMSTLREIAGDKTNFYSTADRLSAAQQLLERVA